MNRVYYFTLEELLKQENPNYQVLSSVSGNKISWSTTMSTYQLEYKYNDTNLATIGEQLMQIVFGEYNDEFIIKKVYNAIFRVDPDTIVFTSDEKRRVFAEFVNIINLTAQRYIPLLQSFEANKASPLAKLKSTTNSLNRYNDTPQDEGDFANDSHTSNISESSVEVEADSNDIAIRLDQLYRNWRSVLRDWANEFKGLFYVTGA